MLVAKESARARGKALRAGLTQDARTARDILITRQAQQAFDWGTFERIHLYLPIDEQHEISTWKLVRWFWEQFPGVSTYVPVIRDGLMQSVRVSSQTQFVKGSFGIPEPVDEPASPLGLFDLVIVPLLAFDAMGNRVGYGRGHYDRFLSAQPQSQKIGLGYEEWRVEGRIATEPHDMKLDGVITENRMHRFTEASSNTVLE